MNILKSICVVIFFITGVIPLVSGQDISLRGQWKFHVGDNMKWAEATFNDSDWEFIYAPSAWEDEGFNGYDGFAWYRKKFDGRRLSEEESYYLNLGYIDDADEVFLNGECVGLSGTMPPHFKTAYNTERKYNLPNHLINFKGENIIAVRVFDVIHGGGIVDGSLGIYRAPKSRMLVDLQGLWSFATSWSGGPIKNEKDWGKIMVPSPWEQQGYSRYDGFAWYKRTFSIPQSQLVKEEDLILILGKIDDFDKVYLNGKMIGKTYDGQPYGRSQSYAKLRVYTVPYSLIKADDNLLEVLVEDMGNVGGIYEGPVGITTRSGYERYFR